MSSPSGVPLHESALSATEEGSAENRPIAVREQVPVLVVGGANRRMAYLRLKVLGLGAGSDHWRCGGVPQVVEVEAGR
jgi:hypothetical protein